MKKTLAVLLALILLIPSAVSFADEAEASDKEAIEYALNLKNNPDQVWTYSSDSDS